MNRFIETRAQAAGWFAILLLVLGQILPWTLRSRPVGQVWDMLFSSISRPNPEWLVWLLAPVAAAVLGGRALLRGSNVPRIVSLPAGIFFVTWAGLFLTGVRGYLHFGRPGFLLTFIGLAVITAVALLFPAVAMGQRIRSPSGPRASTGRKS